MLAQKRNDDLETQLREFQQQHQAVVNELTHAKTENAKLLEDIAQLRQTQRTIQEELDVKSELVHTYTHTHAITILNMKQLDKKTREFQRALDLLYQIQLNMSFEQLNEQPSPRTHSTSMTPLPLQRSYNSEQRKTIAERAIQAIMAASSRMLLLLKLS